MSKSKYLFPVVYDGRRANLALLLNSIKRRPEITMAGRF